ncbi:MAG TPA: HEAT repeat domain-containing protein [Gammaproteobacteria bacterium]
MANKICFVRCIAVLLIMISTNHAYATVEDDIQALGAYSKESSEAGMRLLSQGESVLPYCYPVLASSVNYVQLMQLTVLIGEVGDTGSVEHLITMARKHNNHTLLVQTVLLALGLLPQNQSSYEFVVSLLSDSSASPHVVRSALGYFARHEDSRGIRFARRYMGNDADEEIRFAALYTLAILKDSSVRGRVTQELRRVKTDSRKHVLLVGFANISTNAEFDAETAFLDRSSKYYQSAMRENRYRNAIGDEKNRIAREILQKPLMPNDVRRGVKFLLETNQHQELERHLAPDSATVIKNQIKLEVKRNKHDVRIENSNVRVVPMTNQTQ